MLGGGGARGLAHLGVLKAMEDLNIPVLTLNPKPFIFGFSPFSRTLYPGNQQSLNAKHYPQTHSRSPKVLQDFEI